MPSSIVRGYQMQPIMRDFPPLVFIQVKATVSQNAFRHVMENFVLHLLPSLVSSMYSSRRESANKNADMRTWPNDKG